MPPKFKIIEYRPITNLSRLSKLLELVLNSIQPSVSRILVDEQHSSRPNSTASDSMILKRV